MPDFFRGNGWKTDNIPPKEGRPAMQAYIQSIGAWEIIRPDLLATIEYLNGERKTELGVSSQYLNTGSFGSEKFFSTRVLRT